MKIDINVRIPELPLVDPTLPRWWRCWSIVYARCDDFDSIAKVSVATLLHSNDGQITPDILDTYSKGRFPTTVRCGLAFIQRSS